MYLIIEQKRESDMNTFNKRTDELTYDRSGAMASGLCVLKSRRFLVDRGAAVDSRCSVRLQGAAVEQ
jgi:hypothetical protein